MGAFPSLIIINNCHIFLFCRPLKLSLTSNGQKTLRICFICVLHQLWPIPTAKIHNYYRGLMAGTIWGRIWPDHKQQILVASSLYDASVKVCMKKTLEACKSLVNLSSKFLINILDIWKRFYITCFAVA